MAERFGVIEHTQDKRAMLHLLTHHREICEGWIGRWPTHCQSVFAIYEESKLPEGYTKVQKPSEDKIHSRSWWFQDRYYVHMTKTTNQGTWWGKVEWKANPREPGLKKIGAFICDTTKDARHQALAIINKHRKDKERDE